MINFHRPFYGHAARRWLDDALASESLHGGGEMVRRVSGIIEKLCGIPHVLLTASGTSALEIAARVAGFGPGDEVIVPAYSFASSAGAIGVTGARPVFVDVSPSNLCIDLNSAEASATSRTKGIVAVHYAGQACDLNQLKSFVEKHRLILIEDAAQALLCTQNSTMLGTIGPLGCTSFQNGKVFTAGEGGALFINDEKYLGSALQILNKGTNYPDFLAGRVEKYSWSCSGMAEPLSGLPAAILGAQLEEHAEIIARRGEIFDRYAAALQSLPQRRGWGMVRRESNETLTSHVFWLLCSSERERIRFKQHLQSQGIASLTHFSGLHNSAYVREKGWQAGVSLPVSERAEACLIRLPVHSLMTNEDVESVIAAVLGWLDVSEYDERANPVEIAAK